MREAKPLFRSEVGVHGATQFLQSFRHAVSRGFDAHVPLILAPLGVGDARDSLFFNLFLENGEGGGGVGERLLQHGIRLFVLTQARHDADVDARSGVVFGAGEQVSSGLVDALFGETACLVQHAPVLQAARDFEVIAGAFRTALDQRRSQRSDCFFRLTLPGAHGGDLLHPLRIFVGELIDALVVGGSFVEAHQPFFESRPRGV
jgi:hypothetical protein